MRAFEDHGVPTKESRQSDSGKQCAFAWKT